jgi:hypothetical protein
LQPSTDPYGFLKTAADTAGFAGSHFYGRGVRNNLQTSANPAYPTFKDLSDCRLSVDGGDLVLSAGGQTTRVPYTPSQIGSVNGVANYTVRAIVLPRGIYGNTSTVLFAGPVNAQYQQDLISLSIANGIVTDVLANNAATGTQTTCGGTVGSNLNTDRSLDVLNLPTTSLVTDLKAAAVLSAPVTKTRSVTAADLTGLSANINFGRGVFSTFNADYTVKSVTSINDCKVEVKDGKLRMTSVQAAYDHSFPLTAADYSSGFNKDTLQFRGNETADSLSGNTKIIIDFRTVTPFVSAVESLDQVVGKQSLICPRG